MFKFFGQHSKAEVLLEEYQNARAEGNNHAALYLISRIHELQPANKGVRRERAALWLEMNSQTPSSEGATPQVTKTQ